MGALPGLSPLLAHGGVPGMIDEVAGVLFGLLVLGYFIRRSARKERDDGEKASRPHNRSSRVDTSD